ncbi:exonuclease domain-containing protein [Nesterenkonia sp. CL21]|uniref:exonuclease domain-containing protein n=1 Tax=unclassified Nesterenkonia TaxID=2629769 RepID=UPI00287988FB|nr:exonuclease domain-containing protein [Nesterenkonia sp. CL21]MDS2172552.1 exonuclease domain-containing protein [Nesterenkonia sp. CL21]
MSLNFTAVDFETANGFRGSPCSVGLVRIRDGAEAQTLYRELRPPEGYDRFDPKNVAVHGITAEAVASAPRFSEVFPEVIDFIGDDTVVAHNASFDVEVFQAALEVSGMDSPGLESWCSVQLSRAVYDLPSHALPRAAAEAGHVLSRHHHALEDARASAAIVCDIASRTGAADLEELFLAQGLERLRLPAWSGAPDRVSRATTQVRAMGPIFDSRLRTVPDEALPDLLRWQDEGRNLPPAADADPRHPLYGQHVVFTGGLSIPRPEAKRLVAAHGGQTTSRVTAGTTIVVVGDGYTVQGPADQEQLHTNKARDALRRRDLGQPLRVLDESEFRGMLGRAWPAATEPPPTAAVRLTPER